jgi:hypothetical protein
MPIVTNRTRSNTRFTLGYCNVVAAIVVAVGGPCAVSPQAAHAATTPSASDTKADLECRAQLTALRKQAAAGIGVAERRLGDAYSHGCGVDEDKTQAAIFYERAVRNGDSKALSELAYLYQVGEGVPKDSARAYDLYRQAAERDPMSAFTLALMCLHGDGGIPASDEQAAFWMGKAVEGRVSFARSILAEMYAQGRGVPQDFGRAADLTKANAQEGDPIAQFKLAQAYISGRGVPQDYVQAYMWLDLAAARMNSTTWEVFTLDPRDKPLYSHDLFVNGRDGLAARLSAAQLAEGQRLASEWRPTQSPTTTAVQQRPRRRRAKAGSQAVAEGPSAPRW